MMASKHQPRPPPQAPAIVFGHAWRFVAAAIAVLALFFLGRSQFSFIDNAWRSNGWVSWSPPIDSLAIAAEPPQRHVQQDDNVWLGIPSSRTLQWHPCYKDEFQCARLDMPMDWVNPSDSLRVVLALIRLPASNTTAPSEYRGPVFFNPGGPGGSGVWSILDHGKFLQTIVGSNHDIVSFDPRGIGASVPRIECWQTSQDRLFWDLQDVGIVDAHPGVLYDAFARASAFSKSCEATMGADGILSHSSTTYHARDMLGILEQMGETKLKYWGFSYGTVLGATFAAMWPEKVERLVSDGNVDYKEWYYGSYINFLHDTDKVMDAFFEFCYEAGPMSCLFYAPSPAAVKGRLDRLLETLRTSPVLIEPSVNGGPELPELVTYSKVKRMLSTALYQPIYRFRRVAQVLAALEAGDGKPYYDYTHFPGEPTPSTFCSAETVPPTVPTSGEDTDDAFPAIMCSDALQFNETVQGFAAYAKRLQEISYAAGSVQIVFRLACVGRTIRPKWRFEGPFGGNTSHPILFVANIADNVTPLVSATNNSAGFPGSAVLVQNSYGHTSLSAASSCTARYIREYFQEGTLPEPGTVCQPDRTPFGVMFADAIDDVTMHDMDEISYAVERLSRETNWGLLFRPQRP